METPRLDLKSPLYFPSAADCLWRSFAFGNRPRATDRPAVNPQDR